MLSLLLPLVFPFLAAPAAQNALEFDWPATLPQPTRPVWGYEAVFEQNHMIIEDGFGVWWQVMPTWANLENADYYFQIDKDEINPFESLLEVMEPAAGWQRDDRIAFIKNNGPSTIPIDFELKNQAGLELFSGELRPAPFSGSKASTGGWHNVIRGYGVQIAHESSISSPESAYQRFGVSIAVALKPVPGEGWLAEVVMTGSEPLDMPAISFGNGQVKPRIANQVHEMQTWVLLRPGQTTTCTIGGFSLSLSPDAAAPPALIVQDDSVAVCVPTLKGSPQWSALFGADGLMPWSAKGGWVAFTENDARRHAQLLVSAAQTRAQCKTIDVRILKMVADKETEVFHWAGPMHFGHPTRLAEGSSFDALLDWDVEVAAGSRAIAPGFSYLFSGVTGTLELSKENEQWGVDMNLLLRDSRLIGNESVTFCEARGRVKDGEGSAYILPALSGLIETLLTHGSAFSGFYPVQEGKTTRHERKSPQGSLALELTLLAD